MTNNAALISKIRALVFTQTIDETWISATNEIIDMDQNLLNIEYWNQNLATKEVGCVESVISFKEQGLWWERPDGGMAMAVMDNIPHHVTLAKFLMLAKMIKLMNANGELSFVTIGYPAEWNRCTIYLNNEKQNGVITADALLGIVEHHTKDKNGKWKIDEKGEHFEVAKISGIVRIVIEDHTQTFF